MDVTMHAMVVLDAIEGCAVQTETVLRQSLAERVRPCLVVNKVDRCSLELQMEPEDMYSRFRKAIEDVNVVIATYMDDMMGDTQVGPEKGTVAFGSGLHGWGFNVERFAKIYASKMGVDKEKMMKRLWGDSFFNAKKKTWTNVQTPEGSTEKLPRAFCQFIMTPINQLMRAIMDDQKDKYEHDSFGQVAQQAQSYLLAGRAHVGRIGNAHRVWQGWSEGCPEGTHQDPKGYV